MTWLLIAGIALLVKRGDRIAAIWAGLLATLATALIYLPLLLMAAKPSEMNEATNYVADTLLFAGAILVVADAVAAQKRSAVLLS